MTGTCVILEKDEYPRQGWYLHPSGPYFSAQDIHVTLEVMGLAHLCVGPWPGVVVSHLLYRVYSGKCIGHTMSTPPPHFYVLMMLENASNKTYYD